MPVCLPSRAGSSFIIWSFIACLLNKWSHEQDPTRDPEPMKRLRKLSGPGLVIYPLTITVVFVDWVMSLEADWFSTIFPILVCIGQMLSGSGFCHPPAGLDWTADVAVGDHRER